jgi:hypothetical protein
LIAYASRTGTIRNVTALQDAGWRWIVGPLDHGRSLFGMRYALDNGAWPAFSQGIEWSAEAFEDALEEFGPAADFIVVPDVVADAAASLELTREWLPRMLKRPDLAGVPLLIAVQDGMTQAEIGGILELDRRLGIFIGGSTEWKVPAIIPWARWAKDLGRYVHVGRVNTARRIRLCAAGGADSFDGTSATRWAKSITMLDQARLQPAMI